MAALNVSVVSADQEVWSGEASMVVARTVEGEIGILPGHEPMLAALDGVFDAFAVDGRVSFDYDTELYIGPLK